MSTGTYAQGTMETNNVDDDNADGSNQVNIQKIK